MLAAGGEWRDSSWNNDPVFWCIEEDNSLVSRVWNVWVLVRLGDRLISLFEYGGQLLETVSTGAIGTLIRGGEGCRYRGQQRVGKQHAGKCTSNYHGGALAVAGEGAEKTATRFAIGLSPKHLEFRRKKNSSVLKKHTLN